jgi:signal transduction histidine kinase
MELNATALEKQAALNAWITEAKTHAGAIASSPDLQEQAIRLRAARASENQAEAQAAHDLLVTKLQVWSGKGRDYLGWMILDPSSGEVLVATQSDEEGKFREDQLYFIQGKSNPYVQTAYYSPDAQGVLSTVSAPIRTPTGELLGVLAGSLDLNQMNAIILRRTALRQSDDEFLVNKSELFVTQPRLVPDPAVLARGVHTRAVKLCLQEKNGMIYAPDYRNVPSMIVYRWLPENQMCMIVKMDQAEALAPVYDLRNKILITSSLALLAATILAIWLARTISQPIRTLQEGAERFGKGDLEVQVQVDSADEIGVLAAKFNQMARSVADMENQLRQRAVQLEVANQELEAFSYSVSHDLRAPLRAIDGFTRILQEEHAPELSAPAQRYLGLVHQNAQQMGCLVDDLLAFSRLGRQALKLQKVWPAGLAREALETLCTELAGRQVEIRIGDPAASSAESDHELPACQADPALLRQVFANLLSNALKFTRTRPVARIEIGADQSDGQCVYYVKDNGVGFDMQYSNKLFGVFQRLHRAEDYEGTGVGLATIQRIIHRHGGRVWAQAELEAGATFYFTVPGGNLNG